MDANVSVEVLVYNCYTAKEQDEWWEDENDKQSMFFDNALLVIDKDLSFTSRNKKDTRIRQCRVLFSYQQKYQDELNLNVGDIINILGEVEEGWWKGVLNGREGVFPSNFVEEIESKPGSTEDLTNDNENHIKNPLLLPNPTKMECRVKFSYKAQNEDELSLKEGDIINLISKDGQDVGWWKGELNGQIGLFPENFVVLLSDSDEKNRRSLLGGLQKKLVHVFHCFACHTKTN